MNITIRLFVCSAIVMLIQQTVLGQPEDNPPEFRPGGPSFRPGGPGFAPGGPDFDPEGFGVGPGRGPGFGPPPFDGPDQNFGRPPFRPGQNFRQGDFGPPEFHRPKQIATTQQPNEHVLSALTPKEKLETFNSNVEVSFNNKFLIVESNGIPNHPTADYPNEHNPNSILVQDYHFKIPLEPKFAQNKTSLPFGPIGVAVNGIPFYNPYNAQGRDAVFGAYAEVFDSCCGHPDPNGRYHYHKYPVCVNSPFRDPTGKHSPIIGWAFDGFAVYGPNGEDGIPPQDLDDCNGHIDAVRGYHYHVTKNFPYILGAYKGVVELSNFDGPVWGRF